MLTVGWFLWTWLSDWGEQEDLAHSAVGEMNASPSASVKESEECSPVAILAENQERGQASDVLRTETPPPDDDFQEDERARAEAKLRAEELRTGLTFLQRAKLRRQLRSGGIIDVPVFQQRYGPLPPWLLRADSGTALVPSAPDPGRLISIFTRCGGLLLSFLGVWTLDWEALRVCCGSLRRNAVLSLIRQGRNARNVEGPRLAQGSGDSGASLNFPDHALPMLGLTGHSASSEPHGSSEVVARGPMPSSSHADSGEPVEGSWPGEEGSGEPVEGSGLGEEGSVGPVEGSFSGEAAAGDLTAQGLQGPGEGFPQDLSTGPPQVGQGASSHETFPHLLLSPREETGASSSHGMPVSVPMLCYEDYFPTDSHPEFPLVGTWTLAHFLVHVLDVAGSRVLAFLGDRAVEWRALRAASCFLRQAVAAAVAALFWVGPYAVLFQGPQSFAAAEHYLCSGRFLGYDQGPAESSTSRVDPGPVFPQVYWGPPHTVHYLWLLFAQHGYALLNLLGDQVSDWCVLRNVASGFRAGVTYGLILWLNRTGDQYRSRYVRDAASSWEAAQEYLRTGQRVYPDDPASEDSGRVDEHPYRAPRRQEGGVRQVLAVPSDSSDETSEESLDSTTEPSGNSVTASSECVPVEPAPGEHPASELGVGILVVRYEAVAEALVVFHGDDCFEVPLPGWSEEAIQAVAECIQSGNWSEWQEILQILPRPGHEEVAPSERLQLIRYGRLWGRWARFWVVVAVVLGILLWGFRGVGASESSIGEQYCVPESLLSLESQALQLRSEERRPVARVEEGSRCDGETLERLVVCCFIIGTWEITKRAGSWLARSRKVQERGTQTPEMNIVPMPLPLGVRSRARILYSLWRAGYRVQADDYPERVRAQFDSLVGDWLIRNNEGLVSSSSSSD